MHPSPQPALPDSHDILSKAQQHLARAEHMLTQTYRLLKDEKLFIPTLEHIANATEGAMDAFLYSDARYKQIPPVRTSFRDRMLLFRRYCLALHKHRECPMEFSRKSNLVLCSDDYDLDIISEERLRSYLQRAKIFIREATIPLVKN